MRDPRVPSNTARFTGLMIGVITAYLAIVMVQSAATGDSEGFEAAIRIAGGVFLVLVAVAVIALSVFPAQIRRMIRGE